MKYSMLNLMYHNKVLLPLVWLAGLLFCACQPTGSRRHTAVTEGDTLYPRYASLLRYIEGPGWEVAEVLDPWNQGKVLQRYVLVPREDSLPEVLPEGVLVRVPMQRAVVFSAVYASLLADCGRLSQVCGMTDVNYVLAPAVCRSIRSGHIRDLGSAMSPDVERILSVQPDGVLVSAYEQSDYGALARTSVPLIVCADYMENTALGRAEWASFFGRLFGCRDVTDSLFRQVEAAYKRLQKAAKGVSYRPSVLHDKKDGATWFVPGWKSTVGQMLTDAGGRYVYPDNEKSGSLALDFEGVYACAADADVWVVKYGAPVDLTRSSLVADYPPYNRFTAWKKGQIYGCNTLKVPYYDETPFHPERLLADWIKMLHPEVLPQYQLRYFKPMAL